MALNPKKERNIDKGKTHLNFMGSESYDIKSPILRLICMSASSFFGEPMYYKDSGENKQDKWSNNGGLFPGNKYLLDNLRNRLNAIDDYEWRSLSPTNAMEKAIDAALDHDPELTLKWADTLRNEEYIRTTPQVILVRAANNPKIKGTGLVRKYSGSITSRIDELAVQLAYQLSEFGKPIPNSLKRSWKDILSSANEYSLAKYRMEERVVKTVDVGNLAMGKGFYGYESPIGKLMRGELKLGENIKTWESIRSSGGSWEEAIEVMGHMALLRNIRNFVNSNVPTKLWLDKLVNTAEKGKQLPFRYLSAYNANYLAPGMVLDAIEECINMSIANLPTLQGRSLILTDNSGSAQGAPVSKMSKMNVSKVGNLMGVLTGMISDDGRVGVFGDRIEYMSIRKKASVMDQANKLNELGDTVGGSTETGIWLALRKAIKDKEHWDNIFVYSDMQAGHGRLYGSNPKDYAEYAWEGRNIDVPALINKYRKTVNPKVNVFLVQIAGYEDTILPEFYKRTYIIGGWSDSILKFAKRMIDTGNQFFKD